MYQFQSTFRLPSSKKKRMLDVGSASAVGGSMYTGEEDPLDTETALGIRDEDQEEEEERRHHHQEWNPQLPTNAGGGFGGMVRSFS